MSPVIESIKAHKVVNSRGDWTIETHVELSDGSVGIETVPDGASKGMNEAVYVKVEKAIELVSHPINDLLVDKNPFDHKSIDELMIGMDGTTNKSNLGGNSILSVSLATVKACAKARNMELYEYLKEYYGNQNQIIFPTPIFNILNGGKHAHNNLSFQEFMVIPALNTPIDEAIEIGVEIYKILKQQLEEDGHSTGVGDEGGFAPEGFTVSKALNYIRTAASKKYTPGKEVFFGMDVAAESFYSHDEYNIKEENRVLNVSELMSFYKELVTKFELIYLEDPYYEGDHKGWQQIYKELNKKLMIVADDLVVTNPKFLKDAISDKLANAVIVKPNQVGSLTETLDFVRMAQDANMSVIVSHRSGETGEDTFIADLALAVGAEFIKAGAPARGERVVKYNRLLEVFSGLA